MKVIIQRGAEEIGGNCIELQSGDTRILIDYGIPLRKIGENERRDNSITILEDIKGLYGNSETDLKGILISHTHQDHYGILFEKQINPYIPVYITSIMKSIIEITGKMILKRDLKVQIVFFKKAVPFKIGNFTVTAYLTDHSACESFAFIIEAEGKRILYSGDFREHGHKSNAFKYFMKTNTGKIDLAIMEGTMLGRQENEIKTERDVLHEIWSLITKETSSVFVFCSGQNIDLLTSLGAIADKTNRILALDPYIAFILEKLKEEGKKSGENFKIPSLEKGYIYVLPLRENFKKIEAQDKKIYNKIMKKTRSMKWFTINKHKLIIPVSSSSRSWISKLKSDYKKSILFYSMWEGYREQSNFRQTLEFLKDHGTIEYSIHASGHAYEKTLKKVINNKNPKIIVPVHTEHPEKFKELFGDRVRILKNSEILEI